MFLLLFLLVSFVFVLFCFPGKETVLYAILSYILFLIVLDKAMSNERERQQQLNMEVTPFFKIFQQLGLFMEYSICAYRMYS